MAHVDSLLRQLRDRGGSDLHLAAGQVPRVRVHGQLEQLVDVAPPGGDELYAWLGEVSEPHRWTKFRREKEVDFAYDGEDTGRFRVHCFEQENGPSAVFRWIPHDVPSLGALGLPPSLAQLAQLREGLVLVAGPAGAGRTTTMAALVDRINETTARHVITIEDPIEFVHAPRQSVVSQREVGRDAPSAADALRAALRQDADVVVVGELRDPGTTALALRAAETGCLVLATLHAHDAASAVDRVVALAADQQPGDVRQALSEVLAAVVVQLLVPSTDGLRRVPVNEIVRKAPALPDVVRAADASRWTAFVQSGRAQGMQTFDDHLEQLVAGGVVHVDEALCRAADRGRFERLRPAAAGTAR